MLISSKDSLRHCEGGHCPKQAPNWNTEIASSHPCNDRDGYPGATPIASKRRFASAYVAAGNLPLDAAAIFSRK
jgi:hypothetical protein